MPRRAQSTITVAPPEGAVAEDAVVEIGSTAGMLVDPELLAVESLALQELLQCVSPETVGPLVATTSEAPGTVTFQFAAAVSGYSGWMWQVTCAQIPGSAPTVLESELVPGPEAFLAPDWVPMAVRLAAFRAEQAAAGVSVEGDDADADDLTDEIDVFDDYDAEIDDAADPDALPGLLGDDDETSAVTEAAAFPAVEPATKPVEGPPAKRRPARSRRRASQSAGSPASE